MTIIALITAALIGLEIGYLVSEARNKKTIDTLPTQLLIFKPKA